MSMKWMYDSARNRGFMNDRAFQALVDNLYGWASVVLMIAFGIAFFVSLFIGVSEPVILLPFALTISAGLIAAYHFYNALVGFREIRKKAWFIRSSGPRTIKLPDGNESTICYEEYSQGLEE